MLDVGKKGPSSGDDVKSRVLESFVESQRELVR